MNMENKIASIRKLELLSHKNTLIINCSEVKNKESLIKKFYEYLSCPKDFWLNWDAFLDTITDAEFRVKEPITVLFMNYDLIFDWDISQRTILSDILISIIQNNHWTYKILIG